MVGAEQYSEALKNALHDRLKSEVIIKNVPLSADRKTGQELIRQISMVNIQSMISKDIIRSLLIYCLRTFRQSMQI